MKEYTPGVGDSDTSSLDPDPDPENTMDFVYTENTSMNGSITSSVLNVDIDAAEGNYGDGDIINTTETAPSHIRSVSSPENREVEQSNKDSDLDNVNAPNYADSSNENENDTSEPVAKEMSALPVFTNSEVIVMPVEKTRNPTPAKSTIPLRGPGLLVLASTPEREAIKSAVCPRCGLKIDAADTKMIPKERIWIFFMCLFFCFCWWVSWAPFLCKRWYKPVEICPHCYRRIDRPHIGSDSVNAHHP